MRSVARKSMGGFYPIVLYLIFTTLGSMTLTSDTASVQRSLFSSLLDRDDLARLIPNEGHCTIIYAANETKALAGGNEDWDDPTAQVKFIPAEDGKYGIVYFGFRSSAYEAGMNDQGLFFDAAATSPLEVTGSAHKPSSGGYPVTEVMETSATVEEALAVFDQYNLAFMDDFQLMFGDRFGNSAILEGDQVLNKEGEYQIMTNFYQSQLPEGILPGRRFRTAQNMFEATSNISIELFKLILDATHQEGRYPTQFSNIYDLKNRKVYVFYQHDYERVLEIDLKTMLSKGRATYELSEIFAVISRGSASTPESTSEVTTTQTTEAVVQEERSRPDYFWLGIVPPLVILILTLGRGFVRMRRHQGKEAE